MIRLLIGGSPCTKWSIAQKNGRETQPNSGLGWELFLNYKIALDKYKPDYFLYENNKSAAQPIKNEIARQLNVVDTDLMTPDNGVRMTHINSALVSAQNRERFYVTNFGEIYQPQDRGILLQDVLDGITDRDKARTVLSSVGRTTTREYFEKSQNTMAFDPVIMQYPRGKNPGGAKYNKSPTLTANGAWIQNNKLVEPVRVGEIGNGCQGNRIYSVDGKSVAQTATSGGIGSNTGLYAIPVDNGIPPFVIKSYDKAVEKYGYIPEMYNPYNNAEITNKAPTQTTQCDSKTTSSSTVMIVDPIAYASACEWDEYGKPTKAISGADRKVYTVYEVKSGIITIKDKQYPIKLPDGFYIIRKLTVSECKRLQTVPDWYEFPVSNTQAYKMLGNGWTIEVIKYLLSHIPNIQNEDVEVLSMYDGMSCGQIALKEMGCNVVRYYATEIDKYAIQTTQHNFPNTIQLGDAFQVRERGWHI